MSLATERQRNCLKSAQQLDRFEAEYEPLALANARGSLLILQRKRRFGLRLLAFIWLLQGAGLLKDNDGAWNDSHSYSPSCFLHNSYVVLDTFRIYGSAQYIKKKDGKEMDLSFFHSLYFLPFEHTKTPNRAVGACLLPIMILPDEPGYHGRFS